MLNDPLRRAITAFFSPAQSFQVYIHRADGVRFADGCRLESLQIPTENIHTPLTVTLSLLMPEGYFLSADGFGKNIAAIEPRCGYPYAAQAGIGRIYGLYAFAQTVYLDNDGDAQAYLKAVFSARGTVTNPKLMAGGISEALVTTMQGLVVAVPMLFLYTIVQTQSRRLIQVLEEQSAGFVARYQERLHAAKAAA